MRKSNKFKSQAVYGKQGELIGQTIDITKIAEALIKQSKLKIRVIKHKSRKPKMNIEKGVMLRAIKSTPFPEDSKFRFNGIEEGKYLVLVMRSGLSYPYSPEVFEKTFEIIINENS